MKSAKFKLLLLQLIISLTALHANAQTTTWTGNSSQDWFETTNWNNGVPGAASDVIINPAPNQPLLDSTLTIHSLQIASGASFTLLSNDTLTIQSNLLNAGTFTQNAGLIILKGNLSNSGSFALANHTEIRFSGAGNNNISSSSGLNFSTLGIYKTGGNLTSLSALTVHGDLRIAASSEFTLNQPLFLGANQNTAFINDGTFTHNNQIIHLSGTADVSIEGNTQTVFDTLHITKTAGTVIFNQHSTIQQDLTIPSGVVLRVGDNKDLSLEGNLTMHGTNDNTQSASEIYFRGANDALISGTNAPLTFRNFHADKAAGSTITIDIDTEYLYNFNVNSGNTLRIEDGHTTFLQNDFDTRIYGTLSLGDQVAMNYNRNNTEIRIENGGHIIQDTNSTVRSNARINNLNGGSFTITSQSTFISEGIFFRSVDRSMFTMEEQSKLVVFRDLRLRNRVVLDLAQNSWIEFQGTQNSDIEDGNWTLSLPNLRINKGANQVDLRKKVVIENHLDLVSGNIYSTQNYLLIFGENATHSGGKITSYIDGPARKIGNTNFTFPLGDNSQLGKIEIQITTAGDVTDYFEAEYFHTLFQNTAVIAPITDISDKEYWKVNRSGTSTAAVVLHWIDENESGIGPIDIDSTKLTVVQWDTTSMSWADRGNTTTTPTAFVASNTGQDNFSEMEYWTLAYTDGNNPNWEALTWTGSVSNDWNTPANWAPNFVPDSSNNVILLGNRALEGYFNPVIQNNGNNFAKNIYLTERFYPGAPTNTEKSSLIIQSGSLLKVGDGSTESGTIEVYGDLINRGSLQSEMVNRNFTLRNNATFINEGNVNIASSKIEAFSNARITNTGNISTGNDMIFANTTSLINSGDIYVGDDLWFTGSATLNNSNTIEIYDDFLTRDNSVITNTDSIVARGDLETRSNAIIQNNTGAFMQVRRTNFNNNVQYINQGTHQSTSTINMRSRSRLQNNSGAFFGVTGTENASIIISNYVQIENQSGAIFQSRRQFELRSDDVTVHNEGLIRWRQNLRIDGSLTGNGSIEVYDNYSSSRIYGNASPVFSHKLLMNRTGGKVIQERNCVWTNTITVPGTVEYEIRSGNYENKIQGELVVNGTLDIQGDAAITLEKNMVINGDFHYNQSTLRFEGNADASIQGLSNHLEVYNLINDKSGATLSIQMDSLSIHQNFTNTNGVFLLNSGQSVFLQQHLTNDATLTLNQGSTFTFFGDAESEIRGTQSTTFATLNIAKNAGQGNVSNTQNINISQHLELEEGLLINTNNQIISVLDNATSNEGSTTSYVEGKLRKIGDDAYIFPVGKGGRWARIAISNLINANTNDYFEAEYSLGNPTNAPLSPSLNHVSIIEHWDLTRGNTISGTGNTAAQVTLYWEDGNFSQINQDVHGTIDLTVGHYNGSYWENAGTDVISGTATQGSVTSSIQSDFSPFTFASTQAISPLPITLLYFDAKKEGDRTKLNWATTQEFNVSHFEVERSQDALHFETILRKDTPGESSTRKDYEVYDQNPLSGTNYYRIKSIDHDGSVQYSSIKSVQFESTNTLSIDNIYPNPFIEQINIRLNVPTGSEYRILLMDIQGKVVLDQFSRASQSQISQQLNVPQLAQGTYILKVMSQGKQLSKKLIKAN